MATNHFLALFPMAKTTDFANPLMEERRQPVESCDQSNNSESFCANSAATPGFDRGYQRHGISRFSDTEGGKFTKKKLNTTRLYRAA